MFGTCHHQGDRLLAPVTLMEGGQLVAWVTAAIISQIPGAKIQI